MKVAKRVSCGCCTNGCTCQHHMDIPNGMPPKVCEIHRADTSEKTQRLNRKIEPLTVRSYGGV